jgi:hypothetical protein
MSTSGVIVTWPWLWSVLAIFLAGYAAMWVLAFWHGRRERDIGYDDGVLDGEASSSKSAADAAYWQGVSDALGTRQAAIPATVPEYVGTVTTMDLPDDTFPGWPSSGRHSRGPGLVETMTGTAAERMLTTGDLSLLPSLVQGDDFLRRLDSWERAARVECEGILS